MPIAKGPFEVKVSPIEAYNTDPSAKLGRMSIDKQFHGDLEATSKGEMLHAMGETKGFGAYVAVERVTGSLADKNGSFALHHVGVMENSVPALLSVNVVPDSGTGALAGLRGKMNIIIEGKAHSYEFDYSFS
jgi:Protein of unknown function (DUF3224)